MGNETMVFFSINGTEVCGRVTPNAGAREGAPLKMAAHLDHMHLIDNASAGCCSAICSLLSNHLSATLIARSGNSAARRNMVRCRKALVRGRTNRETCAVPDCDECGDLAGGTDRPWRRRLSAAVKKLHAAADHEGHHRRFRQPASGTGAARRARGRDCARQSAAAPAAAAAGKDPGLHRQLLGARAARGAPAQHVHEESGRGGRPGRHHRAAGVHRAVDLHARGRARARHQGPGQDGEGQGLAERGLRLHLHDRRVGARARAAARGRRRR